MHLTYKHTLYACYAGYITQAAVNNLAPLLFIVFQTQFGLSFEMVGRLILINFGTQLLADVLAVKLEDQVGELHKMTHILCSQGLNIEYMYGLASAVRRAMIVKASDGEAAGRAILDGGLELYSNEEMCR